MRKKILALLIVFILICLPLLTFYITLDNITLAGSTTEQVGANSDDIVVWHTGAAWTSDLNNVNNVAGNGIAAAYAYGSGFRFQTVTIPDGSTITNAYIEVCASHTRATNTPDVYIQAENTSNPATFSTFNNYKNRRGIDGGTDDTTTAIISWSMPDFVLDTWYASPNISTVIQELVNNFDYSAGTNSIVIFWDDHDNRSAAGEYHLAYAHDGTAAKAPKLYIEYTAPVPPTVITNTATSVEETTATLNGNVTATGNGNVSCRGFAWDTSTHGTPNSSTSPATSLYTAGNWTECSGYAAGAFTHNITALTKGELYYNRAASNGSTGLWGWGNETTFLTKPDPPNTFAAINGGGGTINLSWVKGDGADNTEIWGQNGSYPASRGIGTLTYNSTGTTHQDSNPAVGETWYYRAWSFVTEGGLYQYSDTYDEDNALCEPDLPTIVTNAATLIEETTMTLNGNITATGGENLTHRGFEWGLITGTYTSNWTESGSWGTGAYTHGLTALTKGELYYIRAMGNNSTGWGYGSEVKALTKPDAPSNLQDTSVGSDWIALSWTTNNGSDQTMVRYKTGSYPTDYSDGTQGYFGAASTCNVTSLSPATLYYFRAWAYASEDGESQYSDDYTSDTATTSAAVNPVLTTLNATLVEETTATLNGNITQINDGIITDRGFSYDTDSGEPYSLNISYNGSFGLGIYTGNITSLSPGTLYYFRAEATNNVSETGYGSELTFLTKPNAPINLTVTAYTYNDISLSWTKGSGAENTYIRYKTSGYPANTSDGTLGYNNIGTSTTINSLSSGQIYYFRAWSFTNANGWSHYSDNTSDVTDYTSPGDVTGFDAYNPSVSAIDLSWTKGTGGDSTHIRGQIGSYPANVSAGVQIYFSTGNSDTHDGLACNTSWYYRAWAYDTDSGYYSDSYDSDYATTLACPIATPTPTPTPTPSTTTDDTGTMFIAFVLLPLGLFTIGLYWKKIWIVVAASIAFFGLGMFGLAEGSAGEGLWIIGMLCTLFALLVALFAFFRMREKIEPEEILLTDPSEDYENELNNEKDARKEARRKRRGEGDLL